VSRDYSKTLEIGAPIAKCGHCRFGSALIGRWSVEGGRLVWRADPDPQPGRGPDLTSCCESSPVITFKRIVVTEGADWAERDLGAEDVTALRATAAEAQAREMREWHEAERSQQ
jgi:hypothetical protein